MSKLETMCRVEGDDAGGYRVVRPDGSAVGAGYPRLLQANDALRFADKHQK